MSSIDVTFEEHLDHQPSLIQQSKYYDVHESLSLPKEFTSCLKIFNNNARSLMSTHRQYEILLEYLANHNNLTFDVLTFTETWLDETLENSIHFDDYTSIFKHKQPEKRGGGISIHVKNNINFKLRPDLSFNAEMCHMFDCLFIELMSDCAQQTVPIIIGVLYRSPSFNSINEFSRSLQGLIDKIKQENKLMVLVGDLNINLLNHDTHYPTSEFLDSMISFGLIPKITLPTRITHSSATLIDHIFSNISPHESLAGTLKIDISDHFANFICVQRYHLTDRRPKFITYRDMSNKNIIKFHNALSEINWSNVTEHSDPDNAYDNFIHTYNSLKDQYLPLVTKRFNKLRHKLSPWITKGILVSLKTKIKLYNKMISQKNEIRKMLDREKYNTYNRMYKKIVRAAKCLHWQNKFEKSKYDIKSTWNNINIMLNRNNNKSSFPDYFTHNNTTYNTPDAIAEGFNNFYVNIGPDLASKIPVHNENATDYMPRYNLPNTFFLSPTTPHEIITILSKMKPKCSTGLDNISPKLLKQTAPSLAIPLSHIINLSFQSGLVPLNMKIAKVSPFYKSDNPHLFKNYRPISILPSVSKILERAVYNRLLKYLNINKILSSSQFGFRQNLSTEMAITEFQDRLTQQLISGKWGLGVFLDLSKAFDTLNHTILLDKLQHIGIRGIAHNWFNSYLTNRYQSVKLDKYTSSHKLLQTGVPQGSILGPLLFLVYINDLPSIVNCDAILFADDTNLLFYDHNLDSLIRNTNQQLATISKWFQINRLSLNIQKTKFTIFHKPRQQLPPHDHVIELANNKIEQTDVIKFLGAYIDSTLTWQYHIKYKCTQILKVLGVISQFKNNMPVSILKTIYNSLIYPHLSYAITAWGNTNNSQLRRLNLLQKRAIRTICNARYNSHTDPLFKEQYLLKLQDIFKSSCLKLYFTTATNLDSTHYLRNQLPPNSSLHHHNTRQSNHLHSFNSTSTTLSKQLINYKIPQIWNQLPDHLKCLQTNKRQYSAKIKQYLISLYSENCTIQSCFICNRI